MLTSTLAVFSSQPSNTTWASTLSWTQVYLLQLATEWPFRGYQSPACMFSRVKVIHHGRASGGLSAAR